MGLFRKTPEEVKAARAAYVRGDLVFHLILAFDPGDDWNVTLNKVAREGWDVLGQQVAMDGGKTYGIFLWRRMPQPAEG